MAFEILSEEEIALLTIEQRGYYERELEIYRQRAAFVEKLIEIENAEIEPYKPKLRPISVIGEFGVKPFINPKRRNLDFNPMHRPMLSNALTGKANYKMILSEIVRQDIVLKQGFGQNLNHALELTSKADVFRRYEQSRCVLPALSKTYIPDITFIKSEDILPNSFQAAKHMSFSVRHFRAPGKAEVVLSGVFVPKIKAGVFVRPEVSQIDLTVDIKPASAVTPFYKPKFDVTVATDIPQVIIRNHTYQQPEKNKPKFYIDIKNNIEERAFKKPESSRPEFAIDIKNGIEVRTLKKPERNAPKLDIDIKNDIEVKTFKRPECGMARLSKIHSVNISHIGFRTPEKQKLRQIVVARPGIEVAPFKKVQGIKPEISVSIKRVQPVRKFEMPVINRPKIRKTL